MKMNIDKQLKIVLQRLKEKCIYCKRLVAYGSINQHLEVCLKAFQSIVDAPFFGVHCTDFINCPLPDYNDIGDNIFLSGNEENEILPNENNVKIEETGDAEVPSNTFIEYSLPYTNNGIKTEVDSPQEMENEMLKIDCGKKVGYKKFIENNICKKSRKYPNKSQSFKSLVNGSKQKYKTASTSELIKCPIPNCNSSFDRGSLSQHFKQMSHSMRPRCSNCGKRMMFIKFVTHSKECISKGSKPFRCPFNDCYRAFKSLAARTAHITKFHQEPIKCSMPNCNATVSKSLLIRHMRRVHNKLQDECGNCGKIVAPGTFKAHMETCKSKGMRPFKCYIKGCESAFSSLKARSSHLSNVHKEPVHCPFPNCDAVVKKICLAVHIKLVHEKLKGQCKYCSKKVAYTSLKVHMKRCLRKKLREQNEQEVSE